MTAPADTSTAPTSTSVSDAEPVDRNYQAIVDVAVASAAGTDVADGVTAFVVPAGSGVAIIDRDTDEHRRRRGHAPLRTQAETTVVRDEKSLVAAVERYGATDSTVVYADPVGRRVVAVVDDDLGDAYGWRERRVVLELVHTPEWLRWKELDRKLLPQQVFAEHIEESLEDIRDPDGATLLEIAQSMQSTVGVTFEAGVRLRDGQRQFTYKEDQQGTAGRSGTLEIPEVFELALTPWLGRDQAPFIMRARLRYRVTPGGLQVGYVLIDVERTLNTAFLTDVVEPIRVAGLTVLHGTP